jgi:uncharacterized membrane protein YkvA (DUF1232 family)
MIPRFIKENKLLVISVIYILSPIDFLPEFILGPIGIIDDGLLVSFLLARSIYDYRKNNSNK